MTFIINPISGTVKGKLFEEDILGYFPEAEHSTRIVCTRNRGHGTELANSLITMARSFHPINKLLSILSGYCN